MVLAAAAVAVLISGAAPAAADPSRTELGTATLDLRADLLLISDLGGCPAVTSADECAARVVSGDVSGLGRVTGKYSFPLKNVPPPCAAGSGKALAYPMQLTVASKGEIHAAVAEGAACVGGESLRTQTQSFAITGGTGVYVGASGSGTLERTLGEQTNSGRVGRERWTGTLSVSGLDFDITAPTLSGAVNKSVKAKKRAKTARVVFRVTATDDRDSTVPVTCTPMSGTRFKVGRTRVKCSATDSSANTSTASFIVTVRATR